MSFLLAVVGRAVRERIDEALRRHEMSMRHMSALGHLSAGADRSYSELARRAGVTPQSMRATVRELEARGAARRRTQGQGRAASFEVTAVGQRLLARCRSEISNIDDELTNSIGTAAAERVRSSLLVLFLETAQDREEKS